MKSTPPKLANKASASDTNRFNAFFVHPSHGTFLFRQTVRHCCALIGFILCISLAHSEVRTWRNLKGVEIQAELQSIDSLADKVKIKRADGQEFVIPINQLSAADRIYLSKALIDAGGPNSSFATLKLPIGLTIDAPKSWKALVGEKREQVNLAVESMLDLAGVLPEFRKDNVQIFQAACPKEVGYANMAINRDGVNQDFVQQNLISMGADDLTLFDEVMKKEVTSVLEAAGGKILKWNPASKKQIGSLSVIHTEYLRSSAIAGSAPVVVHLYALWRNGEQVTVRFSYRETEKSLWFAVHDRVINSLKPMD